MNVFIIFYMSINQILTNQILLIDVISAIMKKKLRYLNVFFSFTDVTPINCSQFSWANIGHVKCVRWTLHQFSPTRISWSKCTYVDAGFEKASLVCFQSWVHEIMAVRRWYTHNWWTPTYFMILEGENLLASYSYLICQSSILLSQI